LKGVAIDPPHNDCRPVVFVAHIGVGLISPKGLLFVAAANKTTSGSASDIKTSTSAASKTGLYGGIALVVLVAIAGAFVLRRRRQA
jgi:MYXO-CTERM domain-containing protein